MPYSSSTEVTLHRNGSSRGFTPYNSDLYYAQRAPQGHWLPFMIPITAQSQAGMEPEWPTSSPVCFGAAGDGERHLLKGSSL